MPSHRLKAAKRALRREVRAARDALGEMERASGSRRIAERVLALPELEAVRAVMAFASFGSEVDTGPLLEGLALRGVRLAMPRLVDGEIVPTSYALGGMLQPTSFGVPEPVAGDAVPPTELDVVVTPGLAFDREGFRLGYGGGFYDRLFRRIPDGTPRVAIAFAVQVVAQVPHGGTDLPIDVLVTEHEVIRCPR